MTTKALQDPGTGKYNIADYFGPWSPDALKHIFSKVDYNLDETELRKQGVTKEQYLQHPTASISISQLLLEISLQGMHENEKITAEKERFTKNKLNFLIARAIHQALGEEALAMFVRQEHLKEAMHAYRDHVKAIAEENYRRMIAATEQEREEMEEKMKMMYEAEITETLKKSQEDWNYHNDQANHHEAKIESLKKDHANIVEQHLDEYRGALDKAFANTPFAEEWSTVTDEQKNEIMRIAKSRELEASLDFKHTAELIKDESLELKEINRTFDKMIAEEMAKVASQYNASPGSTYPNQQEIKRIALRNVRNTPEGQKLIHAKEEKEKNIARLELKPKELDDAKRAEILNGAIKDVCGNEKFENLAKHGNPGLFIVKHAEVRKVDDKIATKTGEIVQDMVHHKKEHHFHTKEMNKKEIIENKVNNFEVKECGETPLIAKQDNKKIQSW